jgi:hypothetical protein
VGNLKATCAFSSSVFNDIKSQIGVNQHVVVTYPDASTLSLWGWLDSFTPSQFAEGAQPTAAIVVVISNVNANTGAEVAPHYSPGADSSGL